MTIDTKRLRELAEAATPGPWEVEDDGRCAAILTADGFGVALSYPFGNVRTAIKHGRDDSLADAAFIAAASPDVVIALLDAVESGVKLVVSLQDSEDRLREQLATANAEIERLRKSDEWNAAHAKMMARAADTEKAERVYIAKLHSMSSPEVAAEVACLRDQLTSQTRLSESLAAQLDEVAAARNARWRHGVTTEGDFVCPADLERDALRAELDQLRKHVEVNDEEYRTMKDVLRAEHQECQRLRAVLSEVHMTGCSATAKVYRDEIPSLFNEGDGAALYLEDAIGRVLAGPLSDGAKRELAERDSLRTQLAQAKAEADRMRAVYEAATRWREAKRAMHEASVNREVMPWHRVEVAQSEDALKDAIDTISQEGKGDE